MTQSQLRVRFRLFTNMVPSNLVAFDIITCFAGCKLEGSEKISQPSHHFIFLWYYAIEQKQFRWHSLVLDHSIVAWRILANDVCCF